MAPRISSSCHGSEVPQPEDLARQLALTTGQHDASPLDLGVERLPVQVIGDMGGRDRQRGDRCVGEQVEPEGAQTGARGGRARLVSGEHRVLAFEAHQSQALVDLVDDRDRRCPRGLTVGVTVAMGPQVEVEARHGRPFHGVPRAWRGGDHRQARCRHPRLLGSGDDHVHAPGVHLEGNRSEAGDAVDEDEGIRRLGPDRRGQVGDRVHDPGGRLVMRQQDGLGVGRRAQDLAHFVGRRGVAPFSLDLGHVRAVGRRDLGEAVSERADRDAHDTIARRQRVHDSGFQAARAGARQHRDIVRASRSTASSRRGCGRASGRTRALDD